MNLSQWSRRLPLRRESDRQLLPFDRSEVRRGTKIEA